MKRINCPVCGKTLNLITDKELDFNLQNIKKSENVDKIWCDNCKRKIKFIEK